MDLWDLSLWRFTFEGGVDFSGIRYENAAGHIDPHLTNRAFRQLDINVDTSMHMNTRHHGWNSRVVLNYSETSQDGFSFVSTDVIRGESSYEHRT